MVADHFELDPVRDPDFAAQARGADGFVGRVATSGVGQQEIFLRIDVVKERFLAAIEVHAADRHRDHLRAAGFDRPRGFLEGFVFSRADDQAGAEGVAGDYQ